MPWVTEFTDTTPGKRPKRVEYETLEQLGRSRAESRDRVKLSGQVIHKGWVSDRKGYELYRSLITEWYATEDRGIHNPLCPGRVFHSNPGHVCPES